MNTGIHRKRNEGESGWRNTLAHTDEDKSRQMDNYQDKLETPGERQGGLETLYTLVRLFSL